LRTACHLKQIAAAAGILEPLPFEQLLPKPEAQPTIHPDILKEWSQAFFEQVSHSIGVDV
jgi:hypothetical protein